MSHTASSQSYMASSHLTRRSLVRPEATRPVGPHTARNQKQSEHLLRPEAKTYFSFKFIHLIP